VAITILSVASRALVLACEELGIEADRLLQAAGLQRSQLFELDARIDAEAAGVLWVAAFQASGDPELALHAAEATPPGAFKVIDFLIANAPNVGEALTRLARYFPFIDPRGRLYWDGDDPARFTFVSELGELPPEAQRYTLGVIVIRMRATAGVTMALETVHFTFPKPARTATYDRIFGCAVRFSQPRAALVMKRNVLSEPIANADAALLSVLEDHADRLIAEAPKLANALEAKVRAVLRREMKGGIVSAEQVAKQLGLSERTLQRRLDEASTSYADVLADERQSVAEDHLRRGEISLDEIAWLLGFSEQSAFARAFKRWTGQSPGAWRREGRAG